MTELLLKVNIDRNTSETLGDATERPSGFLDYPALMVGISDYFLASRLNNWRAIKIHISLIEEPNSGVYDGRRIVDAIDLCRTHAALGAERNYLGAEKSVGLYLAGVVFGGPHMYKVSILRSYLLTLSIERVSMGIGPVEEVKPFYPIASTFINNLHGIWQRKGSYWDAMKLSLGFAGIDL
jgi:hypothetical protein